MAVITLRDLVNGIKYDKNCYYMIKETYNLKSAILPFLEYFMFKFKCQDLTRGLPTRNLNMAYNYCCFCEVAHSRVGCASEKFFGKTQIFNRAQNGTLTKKDDKVFCIFCQKNICFNSLFHHFWTQDLVRVAELARYNSNTLPTNEKEKILVEHHTAFIITACLIFIFPLSLNLRQNLMYLYLFKESEKENVTFFCTTTDQCNTLSKLVKTTMTKTLSPINKQINETSIWKQRGLCFITDDCTGKFEETVFDLDKEYGKIKKILTLEYQHLRNPKHNQDSVETPADKWELHQFCKQHYSKNLIRVLYYEKLEQMLFKDDGRQNINFLSRDKKSLMTKLDKVYKDNTKSLPTNFSVFHFTQYLRDNVAMTPGQYETKEVHEFFLNCLTKSGYVQIKSLFRDRVKTRQSNRIILSLLNKAVANHHFLFDVLTDNRNNILILQFMFVEHSGISMVRFFRKDIDLSCSSYMLSAAFVQNSTIVEQVDIPVPNMYDFDSYNINFAMIISEIRCSLTPKYIKVKAVVVNYKPLDTLRELTELVCEVLQEQGLEFDPIDYELFKQLFYNSLIEHK